GEDPRLLPGARYWGGFPRLDALWSEAEAGLMPEENPNADIDVDLDLDDGGGSASAPSEPAPQVTTRRRVLRGDAENEAIRALLDRPDDTASNDSNLDALLDQVLEFDSTQAPPIEFEELDDEEVELVDVDPRRPGETLKRIKALLPP